MKEPRLSIDDLRRYEFAELKDSAYLNAASLGPLPRRSRDAMSDYAGRRGRVHTMTANDFTAPSQAARAAVGRLIGAAPDRIALAPNTSFGINLAALGLPIQRGRRVLISDGEFPANVYPWMHRDGYELEIVPLDRNGWPDEARMLERLTKGDVTVLAISSVQFHTGFRADLPALAAECRARDVVLVVDAIQSVGCVPIDVSALPVGIVAAGGHKWTCGPFGTGFVYVTPELDDRLAASNVGWYSMKAARELESVLDYEWEFVEDARRYEVGTQPLQDQAGYAASLDVLSEVGVERIWEHVDALLDPLRQWIAHAPQVRSMTSFEEGRRSGIVSFRTPGLEALTERLQRAGVVCSLREGAVRVAAHGYNRTADIDRLLSVLDESASGGWK